MTGRPKGHSGQFRVRLPVDLHDALVALARRQRTSLNQLVLALLAGAIGWEPSSGDEPPQERPAPEAPPDGWCLAPIWSRPGLPHVPAGDGSWCARCGQIIDRKEAS